MTAAHKTWEVTDSTSWWDVFLVFRSEDAGNERVLPPSRILQTQRNADGFHASEGKLQLSRHYLHRVLPSTMQDALGVCVGYSCEVYRGRALPMVGSGCEQSDTLTSEVMQVVCDTVHNHDSFIVRALRVSSQGYLRTYFVGYVPGMQVACTGKSCSAFKPPYFCLRTQHQRVQVSTG